ncbi:hypothetical protein BCR42DRAFT_412360 [Absidia repens]|uniref:F-box domain-containing protein n=1 Tax=Absidia repens TaxID=90262 RepID=A0A1X2IJI1_9FUNG|nr:hypothetical protein BCR42DRAFT_412360 [Absidia repens]
MKKENTSNNSYSSTSFSTPSIPLRWMPRFMCKSSPLTCRQSAPTFSVASITKVHTFGKHKQQQSDIGSSNNINIDKAGEVVFNGRHTHGSRTKLHQTRQRHHFNDTSNQNSHLNNDSVESIWTKLPMELIQDILARLDCITLYQLCLCSSLFRHLLRKTTMLWRTLKVDSSLPPGRQQQTPLELYKLVCFMVTSGIHVHVNSLVLDGCSFLDPALLDTLIRAYPNLIRLSLVHCPQIGCWQILYMLRASIKGNYQLAMLAKQYQPTQERQQQQRHIDDTTDESKILLAALKTTKQPQQQKMTLFTRTGFSDVGFSSSSSTRDHILGLTNHHHHRHQTHTTDNGNGSSPAEALLPCLKHLTRLDMEGAFPSERSYKSHTHEMYCFGEIKKALLQLGQHQDGDENMAPIYQQLSEAHYALYQFWLLLRSHMLRWDDSGQETNDNEQQQRDHPRGRQWQDFRPPWLPDTLVQFIQITEQDHPSSSVKIDLAPCPLCHRNVAPPPCQRRSLCYACQAPTPMVCAQCRCHSCHAVLCPRCHHTHQVRFRQSTQNESLHQQAFAAGTTITPINTNTTQQDTTKIASLLSSWRTLHCQQCHLPRRICGQPSCSTQLENSKHHRWTCTSCQQQQQWARQRKVPPRFFKKARHWSHWI